MSSPTISIVVPVYGVEAYLERCVKSILAQDYTDYELILVDDGSPDRCPEMCESFAKSDSRIKVIHKPNGGLSSARLIGYKESKGSFISFLDSDDYIEPEMFSTLQKERDRSGADLVLCGWFSENKQSKFAHDLPFGGYLIGKEHIINDYFLPLLGKLPSRYSIPGFMPIRLFRKDLIEETMFVSEREVITEDIIFNLLYSLKTNKIAFVNSHLYHYCFNGTSLTNKYRDGAYEKMMNRYNVCLDICKSNGLANLAMEYLQYNLLSAISFSVLNACKLDDYLRAKKEIKGIFETKQTKELFRHLSKKGLTFQQKIIMGGYYSRMYFILYSILRWRMGL